MSCRHNAWEIGADETFSWRIRLEICRKLRNITDAHQKIISWVADMADAGHSELTHAEIARQLGRGKRTVGEALRRARLLGLLECQAQYRPRPGSVLRWRSANIYRRTMPQSPAVPRPAIRRRHNGGTPGHARKEDLEKRLLNKERGGGAGQIDLLAARRKAMETKFAAPMRPLVKSSCYAR